MTHNYSAVIRVSERTKWDAAAKEYKIVSPAQAVRVFIEIDEQGLAHFLGKKAWANKSKKAHEVGGLVRCVEARPA